MITPQTIDEVKNRLVKLYDPISIILFGSYAWGHPDEDSDLDILVVVEKMDDSNQNNRYYALVAGHKALSGLHISKDILLWTKEEFDSTENNISTLGYTIHKKGKKIYAKA